MSDELEELRAQTELTATEEDTARDFVLARLLETHTMTPAIVKSFNRTAQTCEAQPAIKRVFTKRGPVALPLCVDVPVCFPGSALTFEVNDGDDCVLFFSERCIDNWFSEGGVQEAAEFRMHDLSDAFALCGWNSLPKALADVGPGVELRNRSGSNRLALKPDGTIHIGAAASISTLTPIINGLVLACGVDPFTKMTYFALGATSVQVMAKK